MCPPFCQFYKKVVLRLSEHGDVIETQSMKFCPSKVFLQTLSLQSYECELVYIVLSGIQFQIT